MTPNEIKAVTTLLLETRKARIAAWAAVKALYGVPLGHALERKIKTAADCCDLAYEAVKILAEAERVAPEEAARPADADPRA